MMKTTAVSKSLAMMACGSLLAAAAGVAQRPRARADTFPVVTLPGTQLRHLHSAATGRDYDIQIAPPADYASNPTARYPVLYVLDGQWDFKLMLSVQGGLTYDKWTPQIFIVGITWSGNDPNYDSLRAMDLTPAAMRRLPGSGAAPRFLSFIRTELIPFIDANYRTDPSRRILMGSSFGGLFTLYAMFADPSLFRGYMAASPAVTYANRVGFAEEAAYAAAHKALPVRLFIAVGNQEGLAAPVQELMRVIRGRSYGGLALETRVVERERHSGNKPEAFNRGLRFIFANP
jgi:predicted alpha/beta superfamily hydrolase